VAHAPDLFSCSLLVVFALTALPIGGCSTDPQRELWFDEFQLANRGEVKAAARVAALDGLARRAVSSVDGCLASAAAATRAVAGGLPDALPRNAGLLARDECVEHHPEARYRLLELSTWAGDDSLADVHFERLLLDYPDSLWARQGFELLWRTRKPGLEVNLGQRFASWYQSLAGTSLAGHSLYYGAQALLTRPEAKNSVTEESLSALHLLILLVDHHSDSVLWDDGVMLAADLLADLGYRGDETKLLEEALLPHRARGYDALVGSFSARVRLRLSGLYRRQGKFRDALYQLSLVVNVHDTLSLKDDALWRSATIYATLGRSDAERRTLMFLIEQCPWSRHLDAARERLASVEEQ